MIMLLLYILLVIGFSESHEYEISIDEESPIDTIVLNLTSLASSRITYQLLEGSSLLYFNSTTNLISISKRIDRDTLCPNDDQCSQCFLTVKLYDMFHYDILLLKFKINDINDNQPMFSSNTYSISLTENNIPGIKVRLSKAEDIDCLTNGVQTYELTYVYNNDVMISSISLFHKINQTVINRPFYLIYDSKSELYLIINMSLDRELQHEYIFTITVNDHQHRTSTKLNLFVLDVNDHNPIFSQSVYTVNISHLTPIGTILIKLTAYDSDSDENAHIYYSLLSIDGYKLESNEENDLFHLNSYTGELSLRSKFDRLDSKKIFKLIIGASEGTHNAIPALAAVYINIQDDLDNNSESLIQITFGSNSVSKNLTEVYISENLPNATFIAYIKSDHHLQILSDEGFFVQYLSENSLTLLTDRSYDREKRSSYNVILSNRNIQRCFQIIVTDVNDCKPIWNSSVLDVDLDMYLHLSQPIILTLNASDYDENSKVAYRKKSKSWPEWISLISNELIINCTVPPNETDNDCWFYLSNGEVWLDIEAYDVDQETSSSTVRIRFYRRSILGNDSAFLKINSFYQHRILQWLKSESIIIVIAILIGLLFVIATILTCIYCRIEAKKKTSFLITNVTDDNSTKQKIIQTSSSEQTSSAGSLYDSEKSENITVETSVSLILLN